MAHVIQTMLVRALGVAVALASVTSSALAAPIPGATYSGVASGSGQITFTVSATGSTVTSYSITGVHGNTCTFSGNGVAGSWAGTPIVNNAFDYSVPPSANPPSFVFVGTFPGAQSASGTFDFHNDATTGMSECDSGTLSWTATTASTPPSSGNGGGGGNSGNGGKGGAKQTKVQTRVAFGKLSASKLGGRLRSASTGCIANRTVILWRGSHRVATTHSKADGGYSFSRSRTVRGHKVHVQVTARTVASSICEAVSSGTVKA